MWSTKISQKKHIFFICTNQKNKILIHYVAHKNRLYLTSSKARYSLCHLNYTHSLQINLSLLSNQR